MPPRPLYFAPRQASRPELATHPCASTQTKVRGLPKDGATRLDPTACASESSELRTKAANGRGAGGSADKTCASAPCDRLSAADRRGFESRPLRLRSPGVSAHPRARPRTPRPPKGAHRPLAADFRRPTASCSSLGPSDIDPPASELAPELARARRGRLKVRIGPSRPTFGVQPPLFRVWAPQTSIKRCASSSTGNCLPASSSRRLLLACLLLADTQPRLKGAGRPPFRQGRPLHGGRRPPPTSSPTIIAFAARGVPPIRGPNGKANVAGRR